MKTAKQFLNQFNAFTPTDSHDGNVVKFTNGIVVERRVQENTHFAPYLTYVLIVKVDGKVVSRWGAESDQCNLDIIVWFNNKLTESFRNEKYEIESAKAKYQSLLG
jgi:hypothetical protein